MTVKRYENEQQMGAILGAEIAHDLQVAIKNNGKASLMLPGGSSPLPLMECLSAQRLPWSDIIVSTTDERCVPNDSPSNNATQVIRVIGAQMNIVRVWENGAIGDLSALPLPTTVTVLGMGPDGHFASIFPDTPWDVQTTVPFALIAPKEPKSRVTLPVNILLQSQQLILLVSGSTKIGLIEGILAGNNQDLPVAKLLALAGDKIEIHMAS